MKFLAILAVATSCLAKEIPPNLQAFYDSVRNSGPCTGADLLQGGFHDQQGTSNEWGYCKRDFAGKGLSLHQRPR